MPHVLFVEPHPPSQRPFLRGLNRIGVRLTGIGSAPPSTLDAELRHLLHAYEHLPDPGDVDALTAVVRRVQARGPWVDRLETTFERYLEAVAAAREATKIPGESVATVRTTRDKWACRHVLREAGVHTVPNVPVTTLADARAFAERVGYPLMLKPKVSRGLLVGLVRLDDDAGLERALSALTDPGEHVLERFVEGHEGFFDSLAVRGEVVFEAATHFYPSVRQALTDRSVSPVVVHTNRLAEDGYDELRSANRAAVQALGLGTTAVHLEWFSGPAGRWVSEVGLHPPPLELWDLFGEAGDLDLYQEWGRAVSYGAIERWGPARLAAGLINLRPDQDGVIRGYTGVETMQRRYGALIFRMHLPPPGTPTQPLSAGFMANAWVCAKHADYDELRGILADIGQTVRVLAG